MLHLVAFAFIQPREIDVVDCEKLLITDIIYSWCTEISGLLGDLGVGDKD